MFTIPDFESETIRKHEIVTTFINSLPRARRYYKHYLPLMPLALEQIDLRGYDLVISSESGPAKGIIPPAGAVHGDVPIIVEIEEAALLALSL